MSIPVGSGGGGWGGAMPTPRRTVRRGLDGVFDAWGELLRLINSTVPYGSERLSNDVKGRRAG